MSRESDAKLARAAEHCFIGGIDDAGKNLCEANVPYGIAKIHHVQEQLGFAPDATFVGSPDATVTRNTNRWVQGFGYGGFYSWSGDFTVLDIKANACGMLVGTLDEYPELDDVRERLRALDDAGLELDGVPVGNDLDESNHFVDVFEVSEGDQLEPEEGDFRHCFIIHSSGKEHRGESDAGIGLYWDESEALRELARELETPWGVLRILEGEHAAQWYEFYKRVQSFNHRRREMISQWLFGDFEPLINATHQGLVRGYNLANIGCYTFDSEDSAAERLFPLTLSPELPAFLVRGEQNVAPGTIERLGWAERIDRHGLAERLAHSNLLPHGGGYTYPQLRGVARVVQSGPDERLFELIPSDPARGAPTIRSPRELPYSYRGVEVKERMEELDLGQVVAQLDLKYVLTA